MAVSIQNEDFDPAIEEAEIRATGVGAVVTFTGYVRGENLGDAVEGLFLEHYPSMTERVVEEIISKAEKRWPLLAVRVIHRIGQLRPGERIVFVGVASAHRRAAFNACEFVMDFLKTEAPFWKKERVRSGERWLGMRESDRTARERW